MSRTLETMQQERRELESKLASMKSELQALEQSVVREREAFEKLQAASSRQKAEQARSAEQLKEALAELRTAELACEQRASEAEKQAARVAQEQSLLHELEVSRREKQAELERANVQLSEELVRRDRLREERAQLEQGVASLRRERDILEEQVRYSGDKLQNLKKYGPPLNIWSFCY